MRVDSCDALSSVGSPVLAPLMEVWFEAFGARRTSLGKSLWEHHAQAAAMPALTLRRSEIAPMTRLPTATEKLSYGVALGEDGFREPLVLHAGNWREGDQSLPVYLAVRKADGVPLPLLLHDFLSFALSRDGQDAGRRLTAFYPLKAEDVAAERMRIGEQPITPDENIARYRAALVSGPLCSVGAVQFRSLMDEWLQAFRAVQPGVIRGDAWIHAGSSLSVPGLISGATRLAPSGRHPWPDETEAFSEARPGERLEAITIARGGRTAKGKTRANGVYVHADNPIASLTLAELDAVFGAERRRGHAREVLVWGDFGLGGAWATQPLRPRIDARKLGVIRAFQADVLLQGPWRADVGEMSGDFATLFAGDVGAIAFDFLGREGGPVRALPIAFNAESQPSDGSALDIAAGRYPLSRDIYMLVNRGPASPLPPQVAEFLRFMLSRDGQSLVSAHGFFPLTASEIMAEQAKLDPESQSSNL
jgi:ABC-type phosphate transport system substrate-binding protein